MKVEIITSHNFVELEYKINNFLDNESIKLHDIKFAQSEDEEHLHATALIMYEKLSVSMQEKNKRMREMVNPAEST